MNKSLEDFTFKNHGTYPIEDIKETIDGFTDEWFQNLDRQTAFKEHSTTLTYFLAEYPLSWNPGEPYIGLVVNPNSRLWGQVLPLVSRLENIHEGKVGRVIVPRLKANTSITKHTDQGGYLSVVRRHHIAITTHPDVRFTVGKEEKYLEPGVIWEINNMKMHRAVNGSEIDRVHLLIDIIPNKAIENATI
jgi:hypothetical protein